MDALLNFVGTFKEGCNDCCQKIYEYKKERKSLTCGPGVFSDRVLLKKEVEFVLPLNPYVETNTSRVQTRSSSPDWNGGLTDPERTLRDLVLDHRKASCSETLEEHDEHEINLLSEETKKNQIGCGLRK